MYVVSHQPITQGDADKLKAQLEKCQGLLPGHGLPLDKFQKIETRRRQQPKKVQEVKSPKSVSQENEEELVDENPGHFCDIDHQIEW